ncbi:phosphatidylglycerophosphatase A [Halomonas sp. 707D4]|uniref:phosphatidylglycerophosphatase A family protein n=2 Tax=unclassified Halomonas TaxID=2609666 RepID=UPI0020A22D8E|nr:phosphatidylglycerophosphatase A [Halomonas sp. 707D4]MCP1327202.1 phosphatidylglycerophosphatase A [Halomonas sp. 707D4]
MLETLNIALASGLGLGFVPFAPGTAGTLLGVALAWWLLGLRLGHQFTISAALLCLGVLVCHLAARYHGGIDHGSIVFDEIVAFPLTVMGLAGARTPWAMTTAFIVYRVFDALKPPPVNLAEFAPGGLGVVLDDVIAALLTWLVMVALLGLRHRVFHKAA